MRFTTPELEVFAALRKLIQDGCKTSTEAEPLLRQKFAWLSPTESYRLTMKYGKYRDVIDILLDQHNIKN
jgi:hypothetical protein